MRNKEIIAELKKMIKLSEQALLKYRLQGFEDSIKNLNNIKKYVLSKDYNFLSLDEAIDCYHV